jgi:hypothetical protein
VKEWVPYYKVLLSFKVRCLAQCSISGSWEGVGKVMVFKGETLQRTMKNPKLKVLLSLSHFIIFVVLLVAFTNKKDNSETKPRYLVIRVVKW